MLQSFLVVNSLSIVNSHAMNSSLFFELKLSRFQFLLLLLWGFLKVSPKSKLILAHITFSLSVLFWINLSYLMCVVWLGANVVRNLLSYHNESMPLRQSTSLLYCNHRMITEISCLFTKVELASYISSSYWSKKEPHKIKFHKLEQILNTTIVLWSFDVCDNEYWN